MSQSTLVKVILVVICHHLSLFLASFKEIWNIGERISKGLKVIESIKFNNIIQRRNLISRESKSFTLNNRVRN